VINRELLKGTPYELITSSIGVQELEGRYSCYFSRGICVNTIMPLVEMYADKLHYGLEEFKKYELKYVDRDIEDIINEFIEF
jgi:hypothetical protein